MLELLLHPVAVYAMLAGGLGLCLYLFLLVKRDLHTSEGRWSLKYTSAEKEWRSSLDALQEQVRGLSLTTRLFVPPMAPRSGLNLNKRSQALLMHRRGEEPEQIAAALSVPQSEVDLLLTVNRIALSQASAALLQNGPVDSHYDGRPS